MKPQICYTGRIISICSCRMQNILYVHLWMNKETRGRFCVSINCRWWCFNKQFRLLFPRSINESSVPVKLAQSTVLLSGCQHGACTATVLYGCHMLDSIPSIIPIMRSEIWGDKVSPGLGGNNRIFGQRLNTALSMPCWRDERTVNKNTDTCSH